MLLLRLDAISIPVASCAVCSSDKTEAVEPDRYSAAVNARGLHSHNCSAGTARFSPHIERYSFVCRSFCGVRVRMSTPCGLALTYTNSYLGQGCPSTDSGAVVRGSVSHEASAVNETILETVVNFPGSVWQYRITGAIHSALAPSCCSSHITPGAAATVMEGAKRTCYGCTALYVAFETLGHLGSKPLETSSFLQQLLQLQVWIKPADISHGSVSWKPLSLTSLRMRLS